MPSRPRRSEPPALAWLAKLLLTVAVIVGYTAVVYSRGTSECGSAPVAVAPP